MRKFFAEFKAFISKGNIVDMAIGIIIGGAFGKIVSSLVNDLIMPLVTWGLGASSLSDLSIVLRTTKDVAGNVVSVLTWNYGNFIQTVIDFLIIAFCIFLVLKIMLKSSEAINTLAKDLIKSKPTKKQKALLKVQGIDLKDKEAVKIAMVDIIEKERINNPMPIKPATEQELLVQIRDLLKESATTTPIAATKATAKRSQKDNSKK